MAGLSGPGVGGLLQAPEFLFILSWVLFNVSWLECEWRGSDIEARELDISFPLEGDRDNAWLRLLTELEDVGVLLGDIVADLGLAFLPRLAV